MSRRLILFGQRIPVTTPRPSVRSSDPLAKTKLDYTFNLLVSGFVRDVREGLGGMSLLRRLAQEAGPPKKSEGTPRNDTLALLARKLEAVAGDRGRRRQKPRRPSSPFSENLRILGQTIGLDDTELDVLAFLVASQDRDLRDLIQAIECPTAREVKALLSSATARTPGEIERAISPKGRLLSSGLVSIGRHGDFHERVDVDDRLPSLLSHPSLTEAELVETFLPTATEGSLESSDFQHVSGTIDLAQRILAGALAEKRAGVNLLIYGPTGTGKSELARLLARLVDAPLFVAGKQSSDGEAPCARERLTSLLLGNRILGATKNILLFDELEDLFERDLMAFLTKTRRDNGRVSKAWFNGLLETNATPTIWISNDVAGIDPAYLRRFAYIIELGAPSTSQRRRMWTKHLGERSELRPGEIDTLARTFETSPAEIGGAVAATRLALAGRVDRATLEAVLAPGRKVLQSHRPRTENGDASLYDPELTNAPVDLENIATRLSQAGRDDCGGSSLLLHGPPGTGKSAYVHYLARRLDKPLVSRRASDLLSCWVGEAEKNIAKAFEEAKEEDALLLFDEADSFLRDRRRGTHSWEVSLTNEFLQQLEAFSGTVACTTNFLDSVDQAALRRFTFKIPFLPLRPEQAIRLFRRTFEKLIGAADDDDDIDAVVGIVARMTNLTPGDFAAAARRIRALGASVTPTLLVAELRAEVEVKEQVRTAIGFGGPRGRTIGKF